MPLCARRWQTYCNQAFGSLHNVKLAIAEQAYHVDHPPTGFRGSHIEPVARHAAHDDYDRDRYGFIYVKEQRCIAGTQPALGIWPGTRRSTWSSGT